MRLNARLNVIDGHVACPRTGQLYPLEHCRACVDLEEVEARDHHVVVRCRPDVGSLSGAIDRLARRPA